MSVYIRPRTSTYHAFSTRTYVFSKSNHRSEIPTIIDPVALGYFIVVVGLIVVGISVPARLLLRRRPHSRRGICVLIGRELLHQPSCHQHLQQSPR
jgi:hypothetical protein